MTWLRQYLLCVTSAAIICSLIKTVIASEGAPSTLIKTIAGLFLTISVLAPWKQFDLGYIMNFSQEFSDEANTAAAVGVSLAHEETREIIKEQAEAYILNQAALLGLTLQVNVSLSQSELSVPDSVQLIGNASPYAKEKLSQIISQDLGIPKEQQIWQ